MKNNIKKVVTSDETNNEVFTLILSFAKSKKDRTEQHLVQHVAKGSRKEVSTLFAQYICDLRARCIAAGRPSFYSFDKLLKIEVMQAGEILEGAMNLQSSLVTLDKPTFYTKEGYKETMNNLQNRFLEFFGLRDATNIFDRLLTNEQRAEKKAMLKAQKEKELLKLSLVSMESSEFKSVVEMQSAIGRAKEFRKAIKQAFPTEATAIVNTLLQRVNVDVVGAN